jgi:branched-chain amino acid transport system ATP-binding protein
MLALSSVSAGYGGFQALFDVSLEVNAGESVAVIGPNGAGKTTLLRVISKLIEASQGEIRMQGERLNEVPAHAIIDRGIAHVPENRRLFAKLTVEENLRMGAYTRASRARYAERLEFVYSLFPRMRERRRQVAGTLSGGEQQMCAIGRALMSGPKLMLLDEPSAGLAPVVVQSIFELVRRICKEGYTVLIVEQNIRQVLQVAHRAYLLETGRIRLAGTSAELMQSELIKKAYLGL